MLPGCMFRAAVSFRRLLRQAFGLFLVASLCLAIFALNLAARHPAGAPGQVLARGPPTLAVAAPAEEPSRQRARGATSIATTRLTCIQQPFAGSPARASSVPLLHDAIVETDRDANATVIHAFLPTREDADDFVLEYSLCAAGSWNPGAADGASWDTTIKTHLGHAAEERDALVRRCRRVPQTDAATAIVWHVPREDLHLYHSLYERGAAAIGMQHAAASRRLGRSALRNIVQPSFIANPQLVDPYHHRPSAAHHRKEKRAVQELFEALAGVDEYRWGDQGKHAVAAFECAGLQGVGLLQESPMTYITDEWRAHARALQPPLAELHREMSRRLKARFGTTRLPGGPDPTRYFLHDGRPASRSFDDQERARGVEPALMAEIEGAFAAYPVCLPSQHATGRFSADVPLAVQWRQLQWPGLVVAGEGAFFSLMPLLRPNTTIVMVYNHTRRPERWLHSTFHAVVAVSVPWVRLVVYSVHRGERAPASELARVVASPFTPGVCFVGADADGRPPSHQRHGE